MLYRLSKISTPIIAFSNKSFCFSYRGWKLQTMKQSTYYILLNLPTKYQIWNLVIMRMLVSWYALKVLFPAHDLRQATSSTMRSNCRWFHLVINNIIKQTGSKKVTAPWCKLRTGKKVAHKFEWTCRNHDITRLDKIYIICCGCRNSSASTVPHKIKIFDVHLLISGCTHMFLLAVIFVMTKANFVIVKLVKLVSKNCSKIKVKNSQKKWNLY